MVLYEALLRLLGGRDSVTEAEQFWAGTVQYSTLQVQNSTAQYSSHSRRRRGRHMLALRPARRRGQVQDAGGRPLGDRPQVFCSLWL